MAKTRASSSPIGLHRVLDARRCLPQEAERLDNRLPIYPTELCIDVETLNIDAASFRQMEQQTGSSAREVGRIVLENTRTRGKQHNRVTGSGGMLIGTISEIGPECIAGQGFEIGQRVATLVSLTLTPLHLDEIKHVDIDSHQIDVKGHAILFSTSILAALPVDIPLKTAMAAYDVAGAPATVAAMARKHSRVVIIGAGGKAGLLSCLAARQKLDKTGIVIGIEPSKGAASQLRRTKLCDHVLEVDAQDPIAVLDAVEKKTDGGLADLVVNVASAPNTETGTILATRDGGKILFFGMATAFSRVALTAEGLAKNAQILFGNGYRPGHAKYVIALLRKHPNILNLFNSRYAGRGS